MKKTQKTYLFQIIRKNLFSFLIVSIVVAIGISIYLGSQFSAMAILKHTNNYFAENSLQSLETKTIVKGLYRLSYCIAIIFLIVSIIICYSVISRIINEQREEIGEQKVFGFTSKEILKHYICYSMICGIWSILQGVCLAMFLVQELNLNNYEEVFLLGDIPKVFSWTHTSIVSIICMAVFILSTYIVCAKEIALPVTKLLHMELPERYKPFFFENWKCYQKLNVYSRTTIKNVLEDKSHMIPMVIGITGCTTLLVIGFTVRFAINKYSVIRFDKYYNKDGNIMDIIVIICFILAVAMVVLVVFNYMVMHINQKTKELIAMRINGFTLKETKSFIARNNALSTVIGLILGNGFGIVFGYWIIRVMEVGTIHYVYTPSSKACVLATLVSAFLVFVVNQIALRKIEKLSLIDE